MGDAQTKGQEKPTQAVSVSRSTDAQSDEKEKAKDSFAPALDYTAQTTGQETCPQALGLLVGHPGTLSKELERVVKASSSVADSDSLGMPGVSVLSFQSSKEQEKSGPTLSSPDNTSSTSATECSGLSLSSLSDGTQDYATRAALAIEQGEVDELDRLLQKCCHVNAAGDSGKTLLHLACERESVAACSLLLSQPGVDVNIADSEGRTPLFIVARMGNHQILRQLVHHACDFAVRDSQGNTALHIAAESNQTRMCSDLIKAGVDVNSQNDEGETPLILAVIEENLETVKLLISHGACFDKTNDTGASPLTYSCICGFLEIASYLVAVKCSINHRDSYGNTSLMHACLYGHCKTARFLMENGADVTVTNNLGRSALHIAADNSHAMIVQDLVQYNAEPSQLALGKTPLALAAMQGHAAVVDILAKTKKAVNLVDDISMTALHWAVIGGHTHCVKILLDHGADANLRNTGTGNNSLILATDCGYSEIVNLLVHSNCNVNAVNCQERSALHEAAEKGFLDICELLIPAGAYVNAQSSQCETPLMLATRRGHTPVVAFLLDMSSDVHMTNSRSMSALHEAALWGFSALTYMLLKAGSSVDLPDSEGDTPLLMASMKGHGAVVQLLLQNGCDMNWVNEMGRTALMEAAEHGCGDVVKLLVNAGADVNVCDTEQDSALTLSSAKGHYKVVQQLLQVDCDLYHANRWGRNALHEACAMWSGPVHTVEYLLLAGLDPDIPDYMGNPPLILATLGSSAAIVRELLKGNCDVDQPGKSVHAGNAVHAIQVAVTNETFPIAQMLYLAGCDMNAVNIWMQTSAGLVYMLPVRNLDLKTWLMEVTSNTAPLKLLCRSKIRKCLGKSIIFKLCQLPVPTIIQDYLAMADLEEFVVADEEK